MDEINNGFLQLHSLFSSIINIIIIKVLFHLPREGMTKVL